jgi:pimeloyl-ACP methyl ester carboxylesterase
MAAASINHHREGSGPPLILIHGIGSRWQMWEPVIGELARVREVIAIDLPGFGASPRPVAPEPPPGPGTLARLVGEFLEDLDLGHDRPPHVAGNSLGGWIALSLAAQGRAASATALSPAGFHTQAEGIFLLASLRATLAATRAIAPRAERLTAHGWARRALFAQLVAHGERISPEDAAANIRGVAGATWFEETLDVLVRERFFAGGPLGVPVTIAWGEHDRLLLRRQARRAAREIPGARMLTLAGCGHVPTYDDPGQVARVLLAGSAAA